MEMSGVLRSCAKQVLLKVGMFTQWYSATIACIYLSTYLSAEKNGHYTLVGGDFNHWLFKLQASGKDCEWVFEMLR